MTENFFKVEENDLKNLFNRVKKRDFSGNTGQAIKNSSYQFATNIIMKTGSLLFTIIVARMLLPELFGLYSLALATIVLFASFSDLGIGSAIITYIPKMIGLNKNGKAKAYTEKLFKIKIFFIITVSVVLIASSYFISNYYYNKPIFLALIAGAIYIPFLGLSSFFEHLAKSNNLFREASKKEIIFQISRLIIIPLIILLALRLGISNHTTLFFVISGLGISYLIGTVYLLITLKKKIKFIHSKAKNLTQKESKNLKRFLIPLSATALSGVFFGYIDTIMLGHFVDSEYISFYSSSLSIVGSICAIISFASISLFPIFSKLKGEPLEKMFKKGRNMTGLIAIGTAIIAFFLAPIIINIAYGNSYMMASGVLKLMSALIFIFPLTGIYTSYFISSKKTKIIAILLVFSTIINIVLNYFFISYGLTIGQFEAVLGAGIATIISNILYLGGFIVFRNKK